MKSFITETGETAYVFSSFEEILLKTALKNLLSTLSSMGEDSDD